MKETIVLYPSPGMSHLVSMVELGKAILKHSSSFSVSIIITTVPYDTGSTASYLTAVTTTTPAITFHHLPTIPPPPIPLTPPNVPLLNFEYPRLQNPNLREILVSMSQSGNIIKSFVIDFFCSASTDVSKELSIPTFYFISSSAFGLCMLLYLPTLNEKIERLQDVDNALYDDIPGVPPLHYSDLPAVSCNCKYPTYKLFQQTAKSIQDCSGVMVNTFEFFEERVIKAIKEGKCVPDGRTPPIYSIGPLMSTNKVEGHECLSWLDSQPSRSVVFLCFGSLGVFSKEQLTEIANGFEKSGVRFLWVVRIPPSESETETLYSVLPKGFIERTKHRGFVVKNWAPQVAVLSHGSVGGFLTHCGWSSVRESMCFGVPMIAWPLYAEQKMNRVYVVEELKIGLRVNMSESGYVTAADLDESVRELMESKKGKVLRDRVAMFRNGAVAAMADGGSSKVEILKFIAKVHSSS